MILSVKLSRRECHLAQDFLERDACGLVQAPMTLA